MIRTSNVPPSISAAGKRAEEERLARADLARADFADRLAKCLAEITDRPLMTVHNADGGPDVELRVGAFLPRWLAERAAKLLEEAGL